MRILIHVTTLIQGPYLLALWPMEVNQQIGPAPDSSSHPQVTQSTNIFVGVLICFFYQLFAERNQIKNLQVFLSKKMEKESELLAKINFYREMKVHYFTSKCIHYTPLYNFMINLFYAVLHRQYVHF